MKKFALPGLLIVLLPFLGFAHEGHGHTHGFTITHYFVEPEHLIVLVFLLGSGFLFFRNYNKKKKEQSKV